MTRPRFPPALALALAILAIGWGSILVRLCHSPPLVIAFYRVAIASLLLLPAAGWTGAGRWAGRGALQRLTAAGFLLAVHFGAWIASLEFTTIGSSVVLVSTQPLFSALLSGWLLGEKAPRRLYYGAALSLAGILFISSGDLHWDPRRLIGDILALIGAISAAGYFVAGRSLRQEIPFLRYLFLVYGAAALFLALFAAGAGNSLSGIATRDWLCFLFMAAGPSLIGHGGLNWAVRHMKVYYVNLAAFGEPVLAILLAFLIFGEPVPATLWAGGTMVIVGILISLPRPAGGGRAADEVAAG